MSKFVQAIVPEEIRRIVRYLVVGGVSVAIYLGLLHGSGLLGMPPLVGNFSAYLIATAFAFVASYTFTFRSNVAKGGAAVKYVVLSLAGLAANSVFFFVVFELVGLPAVLTGLLFSALWPWLSYLAQKHLVFD